MRSPVQIQRTAASPSLGPEVTFPPLPRSFSLCSFNRQAMPMCDLRFIFTFLSRDPLPDKPPSPSPLRGGGGEHPAALFIQHRTTQQDVCVSLCVCLCVFSNSSSVRNETFNPCSQEGFYKRATDLNPSPDLGGEAKDFQHLKEEIGEGGQWRSNGVQQPRYRGVRRTCLCFQELGTCHG